MTQDKPPRTALAKRSGNVAVYATAAGLASAVPVPFLDTLLARTSRGAAMRRVAQRHDVQLTREARKVLGSPDLVKKDARVRGYQLARTVLQRFVLPLNAISRLEDGFAALASAALFDHYLETTPRPQGGTLDGDEARWVRGAIDAAVVEGIEDVVRSLPGGAKQLWADLVSTVKTQDVEGRMKHEAVVDTLLDALADLPEDLVRTLVARFEQELASKPGERR
ncbi:MAG: hypothetical protein U0230_04025 [Polyangiales bacterium]